MQDSEIRQNKVTKRWVIFAPARGKRPHDFAARKAKREAVPDHDETCPFCPGNEHMLTSVLMETRHPSLDMWQTRVIPNKFPALAPDGKVSRHREGIYLTMKGFGRHEVIIETPLHNRQVALMTPEEVATVIETYHRRYIDIMAEHENMTIVIFRNHGERAGTSLIHPHSQLIATGWVPRHIRWKEHEAEQYYDEWGRCAYCDIVSFEAEDRRRFVLENESFLAFVPFAADVPFEVWIMPKRHEADFGEITDREKEDLASALHVVLERLHARLGDPDYNYVINTAPRYKCGEPHLHWHLQILPRLTTRAGFEIGSGISINPSFPEADAAYLR